VSYEEEDTWACILNSALCSMIHMRRRIHGHAFSTVLSIAPLYIVQFKYSGPHYYHVAQM
jgi:hypothetical protein